MSWDHPWLLLLCLPAWLVLVACYRRSLHPMPLARRRRLLIVRAAVVLLAVVALAGPAFDRVTEDESVIFVLDRSASQGEGGWRRANEAVARLAASLDRRATVGLLSAADRPIVHRTPSRGLPQPGELADVPATAATSDLAESVRLAAGLFPPGGTRRIVLVGDGLETRGDLTAAAREAALAGIVIDAVGIAGDARPDIRVASLRPSRTRLHEGAPLSLSAEIESSLAGSGRVRLFQNGVEVETRPITLEPGERKTVRFERVVEQRNLYNYRVEVDRFENDQVPANDQASTLVEVRGKPVLLYVEGEPDEAQFLAEAMAEEGIRLVVRTPESMPTRLEELAGYDGLMLSDVPAYKLSEATMGVIRDYVEQLGGGFLMIGGRNSFGVGGYYRTPIEQILPVKMKAPDTEERYSTALVFVIDRSGSMSGQKIEICKSAAIATADMLSSKDFVGVVAFDSQAHWIAPLARVGTTDIAASVSGLNSGGGTNIHPGMVAAREAMAGVQAKVKHMIVLTDGRTSGSNYAALATAIHGEGVTISTVGVGNGADVALLQTIAAAGGGGHYATSDPTAIPRIFTQDAMTHAGRLIREEAFRPQQVERHPMLAGWPADDAPELLGYVKTDRKSTAQAPLVTDLGDPLLAQWRFGLGKVAAFTSDCKSRWSAMWIAGWKSGYSQFWAQVLREVAREPQGHLMDIQVAAENREGTFTVDLLHDAGSFANDAAVETEIYHSQGYGINSGFEPIGRLVLDQIAPGRYSGRFDLPEDGLYLVRARSGARMVSAGLITQPSGETASGQINRALLKKTAETTGGALLTADASSLPTYERPGRTKSIDLRPLLLQLLILLFLIDVAIRRWDNVLALRAILGRSG